MKQLQKVEIGERKFSELLQIIYARIASLSVVSFFLFSNMSKWFAANSDSDSTSSSSDSEDERGAPTQTAFLVRFINDLIFSRQMKACQHCQA